MTFHAPQSNTRLMTIVARRVLCSPATIVVAAAVSTTVVLAERGGDAITASSPPASLISHAGLQRPTIGESFEVASLALSDIPDVLRLPRHRDRKITPRLYRDNTEAPKAETPAKPALDLLHDARLPGPGDSSGGDSPDQPEPKAVQVVSLSPQNRDWSGANSVLAPAFPEIGPIPTTPSASLPEHDSVPSISDLDSRPVVLTLSAKVGETLEGMLERGQLSTDDLRGTIVALRADNVSQSLMEGDMIDLALLAEDDRQLLAIRLRQLGQPPIELRWDGDTAPLWTALDTPKEEAAPETAELPTPTTLSVTGKPDDTIFVSGDITSSLYASATKVGLTAGETKAITNIFRYSVDFERDLRKGDRFEALFEKGENGAYGDILYAKLTNRGSEIALYRGVDDTTGEVGYFDAAGKTNKRSLMRTPVAGAQVSSHFGMRHHPILGYNKMHRGTDFRARTGTPIFAAGDGIVEHLGWKGAYGKYIRIRHNGTYETAYAHMSGYAAGLNHGDRVRQGDVIGYVGSTGRSTGPHLHFEILEHGNQINPLNIADFGPVRGLNGSALSRFLARVSRIEIALSLTRVDTRVATAE